MADFPEQPAVFTPNKRPISPEYAKLVIFINHDFDDFVKEQRNWSNRSESWMKRMVNLYDAQVAFQCYQASIGRGDEPSPNKSSMDGYGFIHREYKDYRAEMVRVGRTILWARKQFGAILQDENPAQLNV